MGFLERAIRRGISEGVGNAIGKAVQQAVEPHASKMVDRAAREVDRRTAETAAQRSRVTSELETAFAGFGQAVQGYATEVGRNVKICPQCGQAARADQKFCPSCGGTLPTQTVAEGAVCTACGQQNTVGTRFCTACGAKLPAALQEEAAQQARDASVMDEWRQHLSAYPEWDQGGTDYCIEGYGEGQFSFSSRHAGSAAAQRAVAGYRQTLRAAGFRPAGRYPDADHLYAMVNGVCYGASFEHCFDGDGDAPMLYFTVGEPQGGFDYVKPEPKKQVGLRDLFGL